MKKQCHAALLQSASRHRHDTAAICQSMPEAKIAQVVQLADLLAKQCGFGQPDSYRTTKPIEQLAQALGIDGALLGQITQSLPVAVEQKAEILQLDVTNAADAYLGIFQKTASQLAHDNSQLCRENQQFKTDSRHLDFATAFLGNIDSETLPIDIAEDFAVRWQQFYQTGPVCLYLRSPVNSEVIKAVVVENSSDSKAVLLKAPTEIPALAQPRSDVLDASEYAGWLLEQLDIELDPDNTKLVPLTSRGKSIGAIVFELHYPVQTEQICERFRASAAIAATVLDMALTSETHQHLAEQIVRLLGQKTESNETLTAPVDLPEQDPMEIVAEMAAGAAHELNNPLSVISGRAQLLNKSETDSEKKRMLGQIQKNAAEIAAIIDGLMSFAQPAEPRPNSTDATEILDEARQLATHSIKDAKVDFEIDAENRAMPVFADSAQIVTSIANIFSNAIESYDGKTGSVKVTAQKEGDFVRIIITDSGCGMDALTVKKAMYPFFSAKPAGRKRGNGLAVANQLIELNRGKLKIVSQPGIGSKVTILLPCGSGRSERQL
ncbi:MAG: sensor histidine kinase [Planctomycetota bacterium]